MAISGKMPCFPSDGPIANMRYSSSVDRSFSVYARTVKILSSPFGIACVLLVALSGRILLIEDLSHGERFLGIVPDDSFYYFKIAKNVVEGRGSTFDGLMPTNGYHPLWLGLLLPVFAMPWPPLYAVLSAMGLGALLWVSGGVLVYDIAGRLLKGTEARLAMLILYLYAPSCIVFSINGLETSLVVLLHLALLSLVFRTVDNEKKMTLTFYAGYGALCGLLFLARTDSAILVLLLTLALGIDVPSSERTNRLRQLAFSASIGIAIAMPWLVWNLITFGDVIQSSGTALTWLSQEYSRGAEMLSPFSMAQRSFTHFVNGVRATWEFAGLPKDWLWLSIPLSLFLFVTLLNVWRKQRGHRLTWIIVAVISSQILLVFVHTAVRWFPREWYYALPVLVLYMLLLYFTTRLFSRGVFAIGIIACALIVANQWEGLRPNLMYPGQIGGWEGAEAMDDQFEEGQLFGSVDAGIAGYVMSRVRTVNLDGLVNSEVMDYYERGELLQYLRKWNIKYSYLREPYTHPVFMGPGGLYLKGAKPYGQPQIYELLSDEEMLQVQYPVDQVLLGSLEANRYLGRGWAIHLGDEPFRWALGEQSDLYLPLHGDTSFLLTLDMQPFEALGRIELEVLLNDTKLAKFPLDLEWQEITVTLPADAVVRGANKLTLKPSKAAAPADVMKSRDKRPLSVGVRSMQVTTP